MARPARMVYEAGPTGYGLARRALAEGIELGVCAPGKTERRRADRVKTDKRDAIRLARLLAAGELVLVTIPSVEREQLRDLVRCREDIRADLMRARHRIGKFLLRREIYWEGPAEAWTRKHRSWLTSVRFADHGLAGDAGRLSARPRRADRPPRPGRGRARQARAHRPVRAHGRAAAVPARDRHADRARAVRRDRRVGALRSSRPALRLPRDRSLRAHHRRPAPARDRSPRPAPPTPGGCWSRPPTTTAAGPLSGRRSSAASAGTRPRSSTSPGKRNAGSTPAGASSKTPAANPAGSSRSRSPASSPPTAGRSPPAAHPDRCRRHPCRRATPSRRQPRSHRSKQPPAGGSPTHAETPLDNPLRLARRPEASRLAHSNSAIRRLSTRPPGRPRSTLDSGRATNKGLGTSPRI